MMNLGIRIKFLALFVSVTLIPLIMALVIMSRSERKLRIADYGHTVEATAKSNALTLEIIAHKDIEKLIHLIVYSRDIKSACMAETQRLDPETLQQNDMKIARLPLDDPWMQPFFTGKAAERLGLVVKNNPSIREVILTDRHGQLLAASDRPEDFYQADETWWMETWNGGKGKIYIQDVQFDPSARVWSVSFCLPIVDDNDKLIGTTKVVADILSWAENLRWMTGGLEQDPELKMSRMVVSRPDGLVIFRSQEDGASQPYTPLSEQVRNWEGDVTRGFSGWRVTADGRLQGFSPVIFANVTSRWEVASPGWSVITDMPETQALGGIKALSFIMFTVGMAVILVIFFVGWGLAEHGIIRRIRKLKWAAKKVAEGDLSYRIDNASAVRRFIGSDELDDLADNFNTMVNRVQKSHEMLTKANELKTNFIQIAGHELRTPLSYILAMVNLMNKCEDPSRMYKAIDSIGERAKSLEAIITSMFKLMTQQGRLVELKYERIKVQDILETIYNDCIIFMETRHQKLIFTQVETLPEIRADRRKLCDALENLIVNAIKFTPDGGTVRVEASQQLGGCVAISVKDEGPGISAQDLPNIFDPFYSSSDVMRHSSGEIGYQKRGMGLGLAIVRHFIEMHGGTVHVSTSTKGSVFTLTIPVEPGGEHAHNE